MENNNGKGIFYGVIGVATLIVAIIGATFAYFTATNTSGELVTGGAAKAGLTVEVARMTGASESDKTGNFVMVPQLDKGLSSAIVGRASGTNGGTPCIDANGSLVCSIYKILVRNTGTAAISVNGKIEFFNTALDQITPNGDAGATITDSENASVFNHLKWAKLDNPTTVVDGNYTYAQVTSTGEGKTGELSTVMPTTLTDYTANGGKYQTTSDGRDLTYARTNTNQYLFARPLNNAETNKRDLLGTWTNDEDKNYVASHGKYTDLVDPTGDLTEDWADAGKQSYGEFQLKAAGENGDTKVFYIVVWISENLYAQDEEDKGTFAGQVTFNSAAGTGATSTFTEAYTSGA